MTFRNLLKIWTLAITMATLQACASTPDVKPQKTDEHIKTEVPPPFPITPESLRKEREEAARKAGVKPEDQ